jgi:prophage DNA circulation protein
MPIFLEPEIGADNLKAIRGKLYQAKWKGIKFIVDSITSTGGQKTIIHEYPNSNVRTIESLGLFNREFEVKAIISGAGYFELKKRLTYVLSKPGKGTFTHPFDGDIDCYVDGNYSIEETDRSLGASIITFKLVVAEEKKNPLAIENNPAAIAKKCNDCNKTLAAGVSNGFPSDGFFPTNVKKVLDKTKSISTFITDKKKVFQQSKDTVSGVQREIDNFVGDVASLINQPAQLGVRIVGLYQSVTTLYTVPKERLEAMFQFFGFGDTDVDNPEPTTFARQQANSAINTLNSTMNACALSEAYRAAITVDYESVDEVESAQNALEKQYRNVFGGVNINDYSEVSLTIETISAFEDLRSSMQIYMNNKHLNAPRIVSVYSENIPAQVLSYQYYGNSYQASRILSINNLSEPSFVEGDTNLLTVK